MVTSIPSFEKFVLLLIEFNKRIGGGEGELRDYTMKIIHSIASKIEG